MRRTLLRVTSVMGMAMVLAIGISWVLRSPATDVIPLEFQGTWLDQGAECQDADAQARVTGSTVDYDHLSFKADGLVERKDDLVLLTGLSYPEGNEERETVGLQMSDHRAQLVISAPDLRNKGPFVRCSSDAR